MGYEQPSYTWQTWMTIKNGIRERHEWEQAKAWAKVFHPTWVQLATQRKRPEIRKTYRTKILNEYRGCNNGR